jgi:C1A family cysteine protease
LGSFLPSFILFVYLGAYKYLLRRGTEDKTFVSRLFIYYNGRATDPRLAPYIAYDTGCDIKSAMTALQKYGTCDENYWPFREDFIPVQPYQEVYQAAQKYTILEYNDFHPDLNTMKDCLAQGFPFIFGMKLFNSFAATESNGGRLSYPGPNDKAVSKHTLSVFS